MQGTVGRVWITQVSSAGYSRESVDYTGEQCRVQYGECGLHR